MVFLLKAMLFPACMSETDTLESYEFFLEEAPLDEGM